MLQWASGFFFAALTGLHKALPFSRQRSMDRQKAKMCGTTRTSVKDNGKGSVPKLRVDTNPTSTVPLVHDEFADLFESKGRQNKGP